MRERHISTTYLESKDVEELAKQRKYRTLGSLGHSDNIILQILEKTRGIQKGCAESIHSLQEAVLL